MSILRRQDDQSKTLDEIHQLARMKLDVDRHSSVINRPIWLVFIGRNPDFVGRSHIIEELQGRLNFVANTVQKAVLYGLGGVG